MHCFAGCETAHVLQCMGLSLTDLFPGPLRGGARVRPAFTAIEALRALAREAGLVAIAASDIAAGKALSEADASRVCVAAGRLATALEFIHGR
jgi:hypothetical protein